MLNGLLIREDWEKAIRIPLGAVPAGLTLCLCFSIDKDSSSLFTSSKFELDKIQNPGTGNGMAKSLLDSHGEPCAASNAALFIIRGRLYSIFIHSKFFFF